jgi:hypothetical protein
MAAMPNAEAEQSLRNQEPRLFLDAQCQTLPQADQHAHETNSRCLHV